MRLLTEWRCSTPRERNALTSAELTARVRVLTPLYVKIMLWAARVMAWRVRKSVMTRADCRSSGIVRPCSDDEAHAADEVTSASQDPAHESRPL